MGVTDLKKKLPVGIENFAEIQTERFYYVDKTAMIRDLLGVWGKVNLFTRPRRFGKSLNMSMLQTFFEIGADRHLFDGLEISREEALCEKYMGRFPVISISLKSVSGPDYGTARSIMCSQIGREALRFLFLLDSDRLADYEKEMYRKLVNVDLKQPDYFSMSDDVLTGSMKTLSSLLHKHYGEKVILLIDEYDVPLAKASEKGYYDQMVDLIRGMFDQALKTNGSLYFAVMTGCLRVAKESIFTGLNNLNVLSITAVHFDEYFGFTDGEVKEMLEYYGFMDKYDAIKEWYDGYRFGNIDVYCPWDVISYCYELMADLSASPRDYWVNTSGNDVVRRFLEKSGVGRTKDEIEALVAGKTVTKEIHEELTYRNLYDSIDNIWSVLFTTGYLTKREAAGEDTYKLAIPNREIRKIFTRQIMEMFKADVAKDGESVNALCAALKNGDAAETERLFTAYLGRTISIRDSYVRKERKENFYHGILLGILSFKEDWIVWSNGEAGEGYSDILIETEDEDTGIVIEVKYAENARYESACAEALAQIEKENYAERLREDDRHTIHKYGIACYKKKCRVVHAKERKTD